MVPKKNGAIALREDTNPAAVLVLLISVDSYALWITLIVSCSKRCKHKQVCSTKEAMRVVAFGIDQFDLMG
jgi:hypothetical protein